MPRVTKKCDECKADFVSESFRNRRFCSHSCASKRNRRVAKEAGNVPQGRKKTGIIVQCEQCGTEFYKKQWQIKGGVGRFCSGKCQAAWQGRNSVTRDCEWCGKPMVMSPFRSGIQRFCSWECQTEGRSRTAIDRWHNGRRVRKNDDGYLMIFQPDHPAAYKDGWMLEHRWVAEQVCGRELVPTEHVHHINAVRDDNRPENLAVITPIEHRRITNRAMIDKRRSDMEMLEEYRARFGPLT